jgi:hypothetical protein
MIGGDDGLGGGVGEWWIGVGGELDERSRGKNDEV